MTLGLIAWLVDNPGEHCSRDVFHGTAAPKGLPYNQTRTTLERLAKSGLITKRKQLPEEIGNPSNMHRYTGWRWVYSAVRS